MSDITWTGEHAAEWAEHYGGQVIDLDKARARTDAERLAAMGGHQVGNCDGCGVYHTPWNYYFDENGAMREEARRERRETDILVAKESMMQLDPEARRELLTQMLAELP